MGQVTASLRAGAHAMSPLLPSVVPFGVIAGVAARDAGLDAAAALGMSVVIFAGSAQLAGLQLITESALPVVIVLTMLVINLRFAMYSASIAPHLAGLPRRWKWPLAYLLTDQAYAVAITRWRRDPPIADKAAFLLGAAFPLWFVWVVATLAGIAVGNAIPASWQLGFTVPLIFLALLVPAVHDRPSLAAATVGGGIAVAAHGLPFNLGLVTGASAGIVTGLICQRLGGRGHE